MPQMPNMPDFMNVRLMTPRGRQLKALAKSHGMGITEYIEHHIEQNIREGRIPATLDGFTVEIVGSPAKLECETQSVQITIGDFKTWPLVPALAASVGCLLMQAANGHKPTTIADYLIPEEISGNENLFHPSGIILVGPERTVCFKSVGRAVVVHMKDGAKPSVSTSMTRAMARSFARQIIDVSCGLEPDIRASMQEHARDRVKGLAA